MMPQQGQPGYPGMPGQQQGYMMPGQPMGGMQPGYMGQPMPGQPMPGQPMPGQPMQGQMMGQPMGGMAPMGMPGMSPYGAVAPDRMAQLQQKFASVDRDHSGTIDATELCNILSTPSMPFPFASARMLVRQFSQHGIIDFNQFVFLDQWLESMRNAFAMCDRDRSGSISTSELMTILGQQGFSMIPAQNVQSMLSIFKKNKASPDLSYSDFLALMSYLFLCRKLFGQWDTRQTGQISFDLANFIMAGLWFM